jgi:hypothetical protein
MAACRVPDVDLDGKRCPCASGWTCDVSSQTCVEGVPIDAAVDARGCAGMFCDGFESGDMSRWTSVLVTPTATLDVQSTTVHGGSFALDCTVPAIGSGSIAAVVEGFSPVSTGVLAVRAWFYLPQPLIHFDSVITLLGAGMPNHIVTIDADDTQHWTATESGTAGIDHHSTAVAAENSWTCVEVDYTFAPANIALYIGDVPVIDEAAVDTGAMYGEARVGVSRADAAGSRAIVDDIVIAAQHIGCN